MYDTIAWVVLLIAFGVLEAMTASLVSIWFCAAALIALIASAFGASLALQIAVFTVISLLCIALVRPLAKKLIKPGGTERTNSDRILGEQAVVIEAICNLRATGQIRVKGVQWTARSEQEEEIPEGAEVRVLRIEGVKAIVTTAVQQ